MRDRFDELAREWENGGFMRETHAALLRRVAEEAQQELAEMKEQREDCHRTHQNIVARAERAEGALSASREQVRRLTEALGETLPGFVELHAHNIGCPACQSLEFERLVDGCPAIRRAEKALAAEVLRPSHKRSGDDK